MSAPKQPQAIKKDPDSKPSSSSSESWKWKVFGFILFMIIVSVVWSTGIIQDMLAGPKVPLPREVADLSLGMPLDQVVQKFPSIKKKMRPYNNDPLFKIVDIDAAAGLKGASSAEVIFFKDQLYFVSAMWESNDVNTVPVLDWVKEFRRWNLSKTPSTENLGSDAWLKEWNFTDHSTEMVLRDLNYPSHPQRWQDLRDASNGEAQSAFSKYRLEAGS
jgi:hypothetical protein